MGLHCGRESEGKPQTTQVVFVARASRPYNPTHSSPGNPRKWFITAYNTTATGSTNQTRDTAGLGKSRIDKYACDAAAQIKLATYPPLIVSNRKLVKNAHRDPYCGLGGIAIINITPSTIKLSHVSGLITTDPANTVATRSTPASGRGPNVAGSRRSNPRPHSGQHAPCTPTSGYLHSKHSMASVIDIYVLSQHNHHPSVNSASAGEPVGALGPISSRAGVSVYCSESPR
jgi:hypothetical protein